MNVIFVCFFNSKNFKADSLFQCKVFCWLPQVTVVRDSVLTCLARMPGVDLLEGADGENRGFNGKQVALI